MKTTPRDKKPLLEEIQEQEGSSFEDDEANNNNSYSAVEEEAVSLGASSKTPKFDLDEVAE